MRVSRILQAQQFLKNRDFIFEKTGEFRKAFGKFAAISSVAYIAFFAFVYNFASPTPDILFDIKRLTSPDFEKYITSNGLQGFDTGHRHQVISYNYADKTFKEFMDKKDTDVTSYSRPS